MASIVGREFTLDQLKSIVEDVTEDRLFEVLEEALDARVIEELAQSVGRYQFTHARIAETMQEMYGDDADAHAAELAHHFAEAQTVLGSEKLVLYSLLAG